MLVDILISAVHYVALLTIFILALKKLEGLRLLNSSGGSVLCVFQLIKTTFSVCFLVNYF